jgi:predicted transcriptional regulator
MSWEDYMRGQKEIIERILGCVNGEPVGFIRLCRQCGLNHKTVRKCLNLIEFLQSKENQVEILRDGFRVVIRRTGTPNV